MDRGFTRIYADGREGDASANLVMDAHLAAIAVENGCVLCSSERDFARFDSVRWENPLSQA